MPTVDGKKFAYTPAGKRAAAAARQAKGGSVAPRPNPGVVPRAKNPDEVKTKSDLLSNNISDAVRNMGY